MNKHSLPPIQRLGDGAVLLTGPAVGAFRYAVRLAIDARRRTGLPVSGDLASLLAAASPHGHRDNIEPPDDDNEDIEWLSTKSASDLIGRSPRSTRRLAPELGGKLSGGRWFIDKQSTLEYLAERKQNGTNQT